MKRFITIILALVMAANMGSIAYATGSNSNPTEITNSSGSASVGVTAGEYEASVASTVYYVRISWDDMTFKYSIVKTWDPTTHTYIASYDWNTEGNTKQRTVTVENRSNAMIKATAELKMNADAEAVGTGGNKTIKGLRFTLDKTEMTLNDPSAEIYHGQAQRGTFLVKAEETGSGPDEDVIGEYKVGTLTITVNAAN